MSTIKEDTKIAHFADNYVKNGMNGLQAYKKIAPHVTDGTAGVESTRLLKKPKVQKAIADRLPSDVVLSSVIRKNITDKPVDKLNHDMQYKYVNLALKLKGYLNESHSTSVNVGLFVDNKEQ